MTAKEQGLPELPAGLEGRLTTHQWILLRECIETEVAKRAALAGRRGEVVAWRSKMPGDNVWFITIHEPTPPEIIKQPLYTHPPAQASGAVTACDWHQQDDGSDCVSTSCGHEFIINDAGEYEDGKPAFPFCCYCAKPQVFHQWQWVDEDAEDGDTAALAQGGGNGR